MYNVGRQVILKKDPASRIYTVTARYYMKIDGKKLARYQICRELTYYKTTHKLTVFAIDLMPYDFSCDACLQPRRGVPYVTADDRDGVPMYSWCFICSKKLGYVR